MKILFISGCAPSKYNHGEPNSYPYFLIQELAKTHQVHVLYFNNHTVKETEFTQDLKDAGTSSFAELVPSKSLYYLYLLLYVPRLLLYRYLKMPPPLPLQVYKRAVSAGTLQTAIRNINPDHIVVFPVQLYLLIKLAAGKKPVTVLCTDSPVLHFGRLLQVSAKISYREKWAKQMLDQNKQLENAFKKINARYLFVGHADKDSFQNNSQQQHCYFLPHHLYTYTANTSGWQPGTPLKVLFAGGGHTTYTGIEQDLIARQIADSGLDKSSFHFHFLGKGYDAAMAILQEKGYTVKQEKWVEDYDLFLASMNVQVFPIALGTGTKAKVLSAMACGVLCIGTYYAFENIEAQEGKDYLLYKDPADVPQQLNDILRQKNIYQQMAAKGEQAILANHNTPIVTAKLVAHLQEHKAS
jgi:glycosyltransferase involved in cell wall biosynthesis